jgi:hypothetical protein
MFLSELKIKNFRQFNDSEPGFVVIFNEGVTALVGENDAGKTAVMDAIRHVLLTRDSEHLRLNPEDFHIKPDGTQSTEILISCKLSKLNESEKGAFAEYLTYEAADASLHLYWVARRLNETPGSRRWIDISVRSGPDGNGPSLDSGNCSLQITNAALKLMEEIYKSDVYFQKCGVMLLETVSKPGAQTDMFGFSNEKPKSEALMNVVDQINKKYNRRTIRSGSDVINQDWGMQRNFLSPDYTNWDQALKIKPTKLLVPRSMAVS